MTKNLATTNQLTITYNNGKAYTIPRVKHFILSDDGKSVTGEYDKQITVNTMTEHHTIKFTLQLMDVVHLDYRAKHGETSLFCGVDKGVITSKTEIRDKDYYERMNRVVCINREPYMNIPDFTLTLEDKQELGKLFLKNNPNFK